MYTKRCVLQLVRTDTPTFLILCHLQPNHRISLLKISAKLFCEIRPCYPTWLLSLRIFRLLIGKDKLWATLLVRSADGSNSSNSAGNDIDRCHGPVIKSTHVFHVILESLHCIWSLTTPKTTFSNSIIFRHKKGNTRLFLCFIIFQFDKKKSPTQ